MITYIDISKVVAVVFIIIGLFTGHINWLLALAIFFAMSEWKFKV